jgi:hypothetical protein
MIFKPKKEKIRGEHYKMRSFIALASLNTVKSHEAKEEEVSEICSTRNEGEK